jgi:hypothetical protein
MKKPRISILSVIIIAASINLSCHRSTSVEKNVVVDPNGNITQDTKVDKEINTKIEDEDVKVESKIDMK